MTDNVVIVGAGLTAASAIETLREEGYAGAITLVGREERLPYERPQLSKDVLKGSEFALLHDADWYAERKVDVITGVEAAALDTAARVVTLADGRALGYDALLIATGAVPRVLDLPGIEKARALRTADNALALKEAFATSQRVALVGGGWIGLEVAAAAIGAGLQAVVLERGDLPLASVLGPDLARYLTDLHVAHGVDIRTGVTVTGIEDGGVHLADGFVGADIVVAATGAVPETALAESGGLTVSDGIETDSALRASAPGVWAAGDVALATHVTLGPLRVEHWDNAVKQGALAARSILGQEAVYDWQPYFFTDQFEFSMEYVGRGAPDDEVIVRGDQAGNEFIAYWLRDAASGRQSVTAGMNVQIWDVNDQLRELVGQQVDPERLTDLR